VSDGPVAQLGAPVSLKVDGDHLASVLKRGKDGAEHLDLTEAAMQEEEWLP
jgi:hypothetical protein